MWVLKVLKYTDTRDLIKGPPRRVTPFHWAPFLHSVWWYTQVSFSAHALRDNIPHWDAPPRLLLCRLYNKPHLEGTCSALHRLRRAPEGRVLPPGDGPREWAIGVLQRECPDVLVNCKWVDTGGSSTVQYSTVQYSTHLHKNNTQNNTMKQNTRT